jgi:hypothetical protein
MPLAIIQKYFIILFDYGFRARQKVPFSIEFSMRKIM